MSHCGTALGDLDLAELKRPQMLANLFDTSEECVELVKGIHGHEYKLHEVVADAELLYDWKVESAAALETRYRLDRANAKRYCLRPAVRVSASDTYSQLLGLDVKLQCSVSKSTFRCKLANPTATKQELETAARTYWLKMLVSFVVEAKLPLCDLADKTSDPQGTLERAFGNRRMRTLRSRARAWKKVSDWMVMFKGYSYPAHVSDMLDYAIFLQQEGAPRGRLDDVCAALSVIEDAGQVPVEQRFSTHRLWLQSMKAYMAELDAQAKPIRRTPPVTVAMVLALEFMAVDEDAVYYARAIAWVVLVCIWACMRLSDLEGLVPGKISLSSRGLKGFLTRTKTTGPGKRVKEVPIFIARNVSLSGADWMKTGWQIWDSFGQFNRDYFVFAAKSDMTGPITKFASVEKIASYVRLVFSMLKRPSKQRFAGWRCKNEQLLNEDGVMFWSGHSMRHFLPSVAASIQIGKDQRDYLGRWRVGLHQSADYVHTSRQIVCNIQIEVSKAICTGEPSFDESELLKEFSDFLEARGSPTTELVSKHRVWRTVNGCYTIGMA